MRFIQRILCVLIAGIVTLSVGSAQAGPKHHSQRWSNADYQQALLSVIDVNRDGTLRIVDWSAAKALLGRDYAQAVGDMNRLNGKIEAGQVKGFTNRADLAGFEPVEPPPLLTNASTLCERTCYRGVCCCRGWWIFCWGNCLC